MKICSALLTVHYLLTNNSPAGLNVSEALMPHFPPSVSTKKLTAVYRTSEFSKTGSEELFLF